MRAIIFSGLLALPGLAMADASYQSPDSIRAAVVEYVLSNAEANTRYEVTVDSVDERLRLPECGKALEIRGNPGFKLLGTTSVSVRCNEARAWMIHAPVRIKAYRKLAVLTAAVLRGATIRPSDVTLREFDISNYPGGFFSSVENVAGKIAKRSLSAGTVLSPMFVNATRWVSRGETVTLIVHAGGLQVRAQGEALADGSENDRVRARNTLTGKIVDGRVISPGVLHVNM